jgi:large subunit ribosomal protein L6
VKARLKPRRQELIMSRIGKKPIAIPKGVTVKVEGNVVDVKGPKGQLRQPLPPGVSAAVEDGNLVTRKDSEARELNKFHGLARSLVNNAVQGVTTGWKKELDIVGVGYRAEVKGRQVALSLGYSHPIMFDVPQGIDIAIDKQTHLIVTGVDRQLVGQVAANLRRLRKPDPYQQKGVRYTGEVLKRKAGKTGA